MGSIQTSLMVNQLIQFNLAEIHAFSELRLIKFPGDVFQQILTEEKTPGAFSGAHIMYI